MASGSTEQQQPDPLDQDLGWMLGVLFRAYVKAVDHVVSDLPGGPRGYQLLAAAAQDAPLNQGAIAQQLGIDRTMLTYLVDDLEELELVVRRPDPQDRRSRRVVVTERGRVLWRERQEAIRRVEAHLLSSLDPDDAATLRRLLQHAAGNLQRLDPLDDLCEVAEQALPPVRQLRRRPPRSPRSTPRIR
jgi:DNA-binding MarR family transcriptional regulator